jgi:secretion/DNA translocation related TadE-like protein
VSRVIGDGAGTSSTRTERGAGTVLVLAVLGTVTLVLAGALVVVTAVRDVHRARAAADLAALAAASGLAVGGTADCAAAATVAHAMRGEVRQCGALADGSVVVDVEVATSWPAGWAGLPEVVRGAARAGLEVVGPT